MFTIIVVFGVIIIVGLVFEELIRALHNARKVINSKDERIDHERSLCAELREVLVEENKVLEAERRAAYACLEMVLDQDKLTIDRARELFDVH